MKLKFSISISLILCLFLACQFYKQESSSLWSQYKKSFVSQKGRVIDSGNNSISHSEGQGYAMLLAISFDDQKTFQNLWHWTKRNLQIRQDQLFAWKWDPKFNSVTDQNNATDGDILIAWALLKASQKWKNPHYLKEANKILKSIKEKLIRQISLGIILLPGAYGFEN